MRYDYECQECKEIQEKDHRMNEKNKEKCVACGAPPEKLKKLISAMRTKHGSWSRWNVI